MSEDDSRPLRDSRYLVGKMIRSAEVCAYWWREFLKEIEIGAEAGEISRTDAVKQLVEIIELLRASLQQVKKTFPAEVQESLRQHHELATNETFDCAERLQLRLSAALWSINSGKHPPEKSR